MRTDGCFFRRLSWMTRAYRSPKTPSNLALATKPGKVNKARIDLGFFIGSHSPKTKPLSGTGRKEKSSMAANSYTRFLLKFLNSRISPARDNEKGARCEEIRQNAG